MKPNDRFWAPRTHYWLSRPRQYWPKEFREYYERNKLEIDNKMKQSKGDLYNG